MKQESSPQELDLALETNIQTIKSAMGNSTDLVMKQFHIGYSKLDAAIFYIRGLVEFLHIQELMEDFIQQTPGFNQDQVANSSYARENPIVYIKHFTSTLIPSEDVGSFQDVYSSILTGNTTLLINGHSMGLSFSTQGGERRNVQEPVAQSVIRGPREGFNESLQTNVSLIRRKIKDPNLWLEQMKIGRVTRTDVGIMYIKGIVSDKLIAEIQQRLERIDTDGIFESGYIESFIEDENFTVFPTMMNTERPDTAAAALLEGRVVIIVDGSPFVLVVPALFIQFFQSAEDYYQRADVGSLLRLLRFFSFFISLIAPSVYIAVATFHHEILPRTLLISLSSSAEGVPFPAFIQVLMLEIMFEFLREAGVRMPKTIGQAISIVGALVLGEAVIKAGLIAPAILIVVSVTAISNFMIPAFNMGIAIRILRFVFMSLAATLGYFGIVMGLVAMLLHLSSLRSFGIPYMAPVAPFINVDQKDALIRMPHWALSKRPRLINQTNRQRGQNESSAQRKPEPREPE